MLGASLVACFSSIILSVSRAVFILAGNVRGYLITDVIEVRYRMYSLGAIPDVGLLLVWYGGNRSKFANTCPNPL